jgi:hypothetical protein
MVQVRNPSLIVTVAAVVLGGCSTAQFGVDMATHPKPYALRKTEPTILRLPQDQRFSIALESDHREPGLDGTADASADAKDTGQGEAAVAVTRSGSAEALFRLGQGFSNDTDRQMDLALVVRYHYDFDARAEPQAGSPDASVGLRLYAHEEHGRMLRDLVLIDYSTENGALQRQGDMHDSFTLTLGPGQAVEVFLAGRAKVDVSAERSASATLKLSELQFEIATRPAPAVSARPEGRGSSAPSGASDEQRPE